jgi:DNA-binding MarR family transcriptional regulator
VKAPIPSDGACPLEVLTAQEWSKDLLVSWLFQTCIKLQTSLDRCFLRYGLTVQEATLLVRCVETQRITPGKLAAIVGRDKGKVTRVIDRLESSGLVTREIYARDRRCSIIRATRKGKQLARDLAYLFDSIRSELFFGIAESDVLQLGAMLPQLHKNASTIDSGLNSHPARRRRRIGIPRSKPQGPHMREPEGAEDVLTPSPNAYATNMLAIDQEAHESELIGHEQTRQEKITLKFAQEHRNSFLK